MSEERLQILKMLADKTISVEEAERLLRAVETGDARKAGAKAPPRTGGFAFGGLDQIGAALDAVGEVIEDSVNDALEGIGWEGGAADAADVTLQDGGFAVPVGTRLVLRHRKGGAAGLELVGADGDRCTVNADQVTGLRVRRRGSNRILVLWDSGSLRAQVPSTAAGLKARLLGGAIKAEALPCPAQLKTMGGDVELRGLRHPFDAKTMGGAVLASIERAFAGRGRAVTMGGDIRARVPAGLALTAQTMGGAVEIDAALGEAVRHTAGGGWRVDVGAPGPTATAVIELKTMGGNVRVEAAP